MTNSSSLASSTASPSKHQVIRIESLHPEKESTSKKRPESDLPMNPSDHLRRMRRESFLARVKFCIGLLAVLVFIGCSVALYIHFRQK